jgi:glyoxylase I family protein
MADFPTMTHVAVTVSDLTVSVPWYQALLGSDPVLDEDTGPFHHTVFLVGDLLFGLHQHTSRGAVTTFDELNVGLDHVAFGVPNRAELAAWAGRLDEMGVAHGDIVDAHYGSGLSFRDPDNIALELFAPPA